MVSTLVAPDRIMVCGRAQRSYEIDDIEARWWMAQTVSRADRLRTLADELLTLAEALDQPSRHIARSNMLIAEGERIAKAVWGAFRGRLE